MNFASENRVLFRWDGIDWCSMAKQVTSIKNRYAKAMMKATIKTVPVLFSCPIYGNITVVDLKPNDGFFAIVPKGTYRATIITKAAEFKFQLTIVYDFIIEN